MDFNQIVQNFVGNLSSFIPGLLAAIFWILIAWLVATAVKTLVNKLLTKFGVDRTLGESLHDAHLGETQNLSKTLSEVVYYSVVLTVNPSSPWFNCSSVTNTKLSQSNFRSLT
jgi:hypothetical protein